MTNIYLYGDLGEKYGKHYNLDVSSVPEAIRALCLTRDGFMEDFRQWTYRVCVGNPDGEHDDLDEDSLTLNTKRDIHIYPVVEGGSSGVGKMIIGAILITASFFVPGAQGWGQAIGLSLTQATTAAVAVFNIGVTLALSGISSLLSPQNTSTSTIFNNDPLAAQQGTPIPVLYGEMYLDPLPISTDVFSNQKPITMSLDNQSTGITETGTDGVSVTGTSIDNWSLYSIPSAL